MTDHVVEITDGVGISDPGMWNQQPDADTLGLVDVVQIDLAEAVDHVGSVTDGVGVEDSGTYAASTNADTLGLVDSVTVVASGDQTKTITDRLPLEDSGGGSSGDAGGDSVGIVDSIEVLVESVDAKSRTITDTLDLGDFTFVDAEGIWTRIIDETLGLADVPLYQATPRPELPIVARQRGRFYRRTGRLVLVPLGRSQPRGFGRAEGWDLASSVFLYDEQEGSADHESASEAVAQVWFAHAGSATSTLRAAMDSALQAAGFRSPDGSDLI